MGMTKHGAQIACADLKVNGYLRKVRLGKNTEAHTGVLNSSAYGGGVEHTGGVPSRVGRPKKAGTAKKSREPEIRDYPKIGITRFLNPKTRSSTRSRRLILVTPKTR